MAGAGGGSQVSGSRGATVEVRGAGSGFPKLHCPSLGLAGPAHASGQDMHHRAPNSTRGALGLSATSHHVVFHPQGACWWSEASQPNDLRALAQQAKVTMHPVTEASCHP